jgi:hypothetical protein
VGGPREISILKLLFGQFEGFWKDKIRKKREVGLEISNIGPFNPARGVHPDSQKWFIDHVIFTQLDVGTGVAINLNMCKNPLGELAIAMTWSLDAMNTAFTKAFILKFRQMLREITL